MPSSVKIEIISGTDHLLSKSIGVRTHEHSSSEQTCRCKPSRDEFLPEAFTYSSPGDANSIVTGTHPTHRYEESKSVPARIQFTAVFSGARSNNKRLIIVTTVTVTKPKIRICVATRTARTFARCFGEFGKELLSSPCRLEPDF